MTKATYKRKHLIEPLWQQAGRYGTTAGAESSHLSHKTGPGMTFETSELTSSDTPPLIRPHFLRKDHTS